jgi:hypothetical protein
LAGLLLKTLALGYIKIKLINWGKRVRKKRVNLNTLLNQIVDSYVNFTANASKADIMPVHKTVLVRLLEAYSEDPLKAMAESIVRNARVEGPLQLRGRYDFETLVDLHESWLRTAGHPYRHTHTHTKDMYSNRHTFMIQHNTGRKIFAPFSRMLEGIFRTCGLKMNYIYA